MILIPAGLLAAGFLAQNATEVAGGGPELPRALSARLPSVGQRTAVVAMVLISVVVSVVLALSATGAEAWQRVMLAMVAGALAANAFLQAAATVVRRRRVPGTITGLALMLPPALWLLWLLPNDRPWALAGSR